MTEVEYYLEISISYSMKKSIYLLSLVIALSYSLSAQKNQLSEGIYAKFYTNKGNIVAVLHYQKCPITVANFVGLSEGTIQNTFKEKGTPYYNGLTFHRVVPNGIIQGGDPKGTGTGGPGYKFKDEIVKELQHNTPGTLSMANSGKNTNGSQFFITHRAIPSLDGKHTVFGKVIEGIEIVNQIKKGDQIQTIEILRIGEKAKKWKTEEVFPDKLRKKTR